MSDDENLSIEDSKQKLHQLRKARRKLEKDLAETMKSFKPPIGTENENSSNKLADIKIKKKMLEHFGVKTTFTGVKRNVAVLTFYDNQKGVVKGECSMKLELKDEEFTILQYTFSKDVCSILTSKKLPITFKDNPGEILPKILECVFAYFNRHHQLSDFMKAYPYAQCIWSSNCQKVEIVLPLEKEDNATFAVMLKLNYNEDQTIPHEFEFSLKLKLFQVPIMMT
ncbi:uncharacterized protein LOC132200997 isoform X2 [Neocloeon triangulifer]|uniref:uncharacterized protein LOC132200997 isoform X2 n=1 Tax=Neocloeon triangulifer TaxID=2078957 RepID=UPI00286EEAB6|nr:uncharacterized protein LOC132200997 isoform X2 [Neocloeon triangulifer]